MTTPTAPDYDGLIERLTKVESSNDGGGPLDIGSVTTNWYRNPDGPEAAAAIRELVAEREGLREALDEISEGVQITRARHLARAALSGRGKP